VVYGMPREAALVGAVDEVASLNDVAARILARLRQ
jgi:two-component system chemotaxis response regulator CheB